MTKKPPSVTAAERTWLTKPPYKRQKKSYVPVPAPQAEAPTAAPAPVPLVTADNAVVRAPVGKKSPPVLPAAPAVAPAPFSLGEPIHPSGIVIEIVGTEMSCQGRSCKEHKICGKVFKENVVVRLRKILLMVEGKEETAITAIWVTDGIDRCRVGFVPRHMVQHATRYDGALAQVTRVFSSDPETCDSTEGCLFFKNKGYCRAVIISTLPGST
jgi:hypothetical protein